MVDITYHKEKKFVIIKLTGLLNREMILDAFDQAVSNDQYEPGMGRLWDFSEADLSGLDANTIRAMTKHPQKYPDGIGDVKVAFVTHRDLEFGLTNMFRLTSDAATPINLFRSIEAAQSWLCSN